MISFLLAWALAAEPLPAQIYREEILTFQIALHEQSCRRKDASDPYVCGSAAPLTERFTVTLQPVAPDALEEQAFEGSTPDFVMPVPALGQFMPKVLVRKSVSLRGQSVIYTLRFRAQQVALQIATPAVFETVYISADTMRMSEPLMLMADRSHAGADYFKQVYFTLVPRVQFANLIPDPEE